MIHIAILGYGTVGSGVAEVIRMNQPSLEKRTGEPIDIKKILDLRDFPGDPLADRLTRDAREIIDDPEIAIVVETIGGAGIAFDLTPAAGTGSRKHVLTSNKETGRHA
jgi:homoserine dehydrogenase